MVSLNLSVLNKFEKDTKLRGKFVSVNPALKLYFWGKYAIVESGIHTLLNLVTCNKSANSCSLADEFEYIVEKEVKVKHVSLSSTIVCKIRIFSCTNFSCTAIMSDVAARNRKQQCSIVCPACKTWFTRKDCQYRINILM